MNGSFNLSEWAINHRSFVGYLMAVCILAGALSYIRLGRTEDPSFTVKIMVVEAQWPGATIDETVQQVTDRIEKQLQELPNVDYVRSYTTAGRAIIFVNLQDSTHGQTVADTWYQARKKINDMRRMLPQGVVGPEFNDEFGDTYGIIYGFTAHGFTHRELRDYVEHIRSRLFQVPDVSKIDIFGAQDERIYIEFSAQQLTGLNVDPWTLVRALQSQNAITPAGVLQTSDERIILRVSGAFTSENDLRSINFAASGRLFRLTDVATVKRSSADPPQPMFRVNGQPAIGIGIAIRDGGDVLALGHNIKRAMTEITIRELPIGIEPILVADQPEIVHRSVNEFMTALWESIAIVLVISFLTLGLRAGGVVALSIPLVLAIVFVMMDLTHIDLQRVSLGALIIALGLLVDDAMITVEAMVTKLEEGWDAAKASTFAYVSTARPMLTGTLVTVVGFIPIGFAKSAAGEYTFSLFAVVGIALLASWVVAVIFTPLIGTVLLSGKTKHRKGHHPGALVRRFRTLLVLVMRGRWITIGLTLAIFAGSAVGLRFIPQQFFPESDRPELVVDLWLPQNTSIYATDRAAAQLDDLLRGDPDIERWSTYVGQGAVRFYLPFDPALPNDAFAQAVIVTKDLEARERVRGRIEKALDNGFETLIGRVYPLQLGLPVGWPLQYRVSGPDPHQVREIAYRVAQKISESPHVQKTNFDWIEPARILRLRVDQDQARLLGISSEMLAQALNAVISGVTITQIRDGIYLIDVVARAKSDERISLSTLGSLLIPLPNGGSVPLLQVVSVGYDQEFPLIWRRDRLPTLTVQSDVLGKLLPITVVQELAPMITELNGDLPPGYSIVAGGTAEESAKSQRSVAAVVPIMLLIMTTLLMVQLQSVQRLFLVLSVAPLGLIGVVVALLASGKPLGFVAILGVIALIGMIVRNSVILIDQIETEIVMGHSRWEAVIEATTHRFRPILLTAFAAIFGMIPIAPTVFWGPMAYAIMGGLAAATVLTLIFLPTLYVVWFRVREPVDAAISKTAQTCTARGRDIDLVLDPISGD
jgi:multidrug efflux pump subunit AcrB